MVKKHISLRMEQICDGHDTDADNEVQADGYSDAFQEDWEWVELEINSSSGISTPKKDLVYQDLRFLRLHWWGQRKTQTIFDKEWLRWAEPSKMNVALSKIEGISRTTHQIRDNGLQPQLCEYFIRGLHKMSTVCSTVTECKWLATSRSQANVES